jgi:hypothetical protein
MVAVSSATDPERTFTGAALLLANPFGLGALATHSRLARAIICAVMQP